MDRRSLLKMPALGILATVPIEGAEADFHVAYHVDHYGGGFTHGHCMLSTLKRLIAAVPGEFRYLRRHEER